MATIRDKTIIRTMLENNGTYPGDPQCDSIWSYISAMDYQQDKVHAIFMNGFHDMFTSPYVHDPRILWSKRYGLTPEGKKWLKENQ